MSESPGPALGLGLGLGYGMAVGGGATGELRITPHPPTQTLWGKEEEERQGFISLSLSIVFPPPFPWCPLAKEEEKALYSTSTVELQ